jgi:uridine kinase
MTRGPPNAAPRRGGPAFLVAVSGISGAGKSTLIDMAVDRLDSATRLHFDDYIVLGNDIGEIMAWLRAGGDPNRLATPRLVADLRRLLAGSSVVPTLCAKPVHPAAVVILEEPFGRARREIAPLIDLAVHLQVPLDVALGRQLLRTIRSHSGKGSDGGGVDLIADIEGQLQAFLAVGRDAYLAAEGFAREAADLVLDGLRPADELVERLLSEIGSRR